MDCLRGVLTESPLHSLTNIQKLASRLCKTLEHEENEVCKKKPRLGERELICNAVDICKYLGMSSLRASSIVEHKQRFKRGNTSVLC